MTALREGELIRLLCASLQRTALSAQLWGGNVGQSLSLDPAEDTPSVFWEACLGGAEPA